MLSPGPVATKFGQPVTYEADRTSCADLALMILPSIEPLRFIDLQGFPVNSLSPWRPLKPVFAGAPGCRDLAENGHSR